MWAIKNIIILLFYYWYLELLIKTSGSSITSRLFISAHEKFLMNYQWRLNSNSRCILPWDELFTAYLGEPEVIRIKVISFIPSFLGTVHVVYKHTTHTLQVMLCKKICNWFFFFLRVMANPDQIHTRFSAQVLPDLWELVYMKHVFMWVFHILVVAGVRFYTITYVSHGQCLCNLWHVSVCWGYSCNVLQNLSAVNILTWVLSIIAR